MIDNEPGLERTTYLEERKLLVDMEWEQSKSFDQALITLSAGALGLSITFVREIAPQPSNTYLLYVAWGGFGLSLLTILLSFLLSQSAARRQRDILDQMQLSGALTEDRNGYADATRHLNVTSIIFFVLGVGSLAIFSGTNLP